MTQTQFVFLVLLSALAVQLTRFLPFAVFGKKEKLPGIIAYLGKVLPAAMMGLLVVYCFKDYSFESLETIIPVAVAGICVAGLHLWKRNTILSISAGTAVYMLLIRIM